MEDNETLAANKRSSQNIGVGCMAVITNTITVSVYAYRTNAKTLI